MAETELQQVEKEIETTTENVVENVKEATGNVEKKIKEVVEEVVRKEDNKDNNVKTEVKEEAPKVKKVSKSKKTEEPELIFDLYDISEVKVTDPGLKGAINLDYKLVIKSRGRNTFKFGKENVNIVERLINTVCVPGHRGKKHKIITRWATGKYNKNAKQVLEALRIIQERTKENPIQVLVNAIERGCPKDEVTMIQYGGARYPQSVDSSPLRRISVALRNISHGAYDKSFRKRKPFSQALAEEIILTANESGDSVAFTKKNELEKQADAAR